MPRIHSLYAAAIGAALLIGGPVSASAIHTDGIHALAFEVVQVGSGTNPTDNPFELLYAGTLTAAMPEPGMLALFGAGLAGLGLLRRRRHTA